MAPVIPFLAQEMLSLTLSVKTLLHINARKLKKKNYIYTSYVYI